MRPKSKQNRKLTHTIFLQREHQLGHHSYDEEMRQYEYIKQGNMLGIEESKDMFTSSKTGVLSDDPLRNTKYLFVASMTLVTRFCIEGGMEAETAYTLSDLYIQQADQCTSVTAVETLHTEMVTDLTQRMAAHQKKAVLSRAVLLCMDFIYYNLHTSITVRALAEHAGLSPSYLSRLFKKETGYSISEYIRRKRVEAAENMLKFSDYTYSEISNYLMFSSQSHFIKVFKEITGYTPKSYRNRFFRHNWPNKE